MLDSEVQNNKLQILGKLAASLAHEIRNPLSAIRLNLEYIKMMEASDEIKESIETSLDAALRIQSLIESTLDFSRTSINDCCFQELNSIVSLAVEIMAGKAKVANIHLEFIPGNNLPPIYVNKNKVLQVLLNLLTNAFEAIDQKGTVILRTYIERSEGNNYLTLEIEDNGRGISSESSEKIFNDFYTSKEGGTGLGLSVCKMILDEYGSNISFESVPSKGTRFFVKFNPNYNGGR